MRGSKDEKQLTADNEKSVGSVVNEKLKYYLIAIMLLLCIVTALLVIFSSEAQELRKEKKNSENAFIYKDSINT